MTGTPDGADVFAGRVAAVVGASRGLGFALATRLGAAGAQLVAVARTVGGLEELDDAVTSAGGPKPVLVPLDITDADGVDRLGAAVFERFGRVDLLALVAAQSSPLSPAAYAAPKDVERAFAVNAMAQWRLIRSFDLLLRQSERPRLLYVADRSPGDQLWSAYAASKSAGETFARAYAAETAAVRLHLAAPPAMPTALRARTHPSEDRAKLTPVHDVADAILADLTAE